MEKLDKNKQAKQSRPGDMEGDIIKIIKDWKDVYRPHYEASLKGRDDKHVYELEKKAVGPDHIATSWIARTLRSDFGHSQNTVDYHITDKINKLEKDEKIHVKVTEPLDPHYTAFDGPLYDTVKSPRRGVRLHEKKSEK